MFLFIYFNVLISINAVVNFHWHATEHDYDQ